MSIFKTFCINHKSIRNIILVVALIVSLIHTSEYSYAQTAQDYVKIADSLFDANQKDKAKAFYTKAAKEGNADANFALAYKYFCTPGENIQYFSEAAKRGHAEAMSELFEVLFFRSNSLTLTNPELALNVYQLFKQHNPEGTFYNDENEVEILKMAAEADPFDAVKFIREYHIIDQDTSDDYDIWQLAEKASRGERFGKPNPKLIFQLVCRGGFVPAELEYAVSNEYKAWKAGRIDTFNICDYAASGAGMAFCAARISNENEKDNLNIIKDLTKTLKNGSGIYLAPAYKVASTFFEHKAFHEEGWGGSGYAAWAMQSSDSQKVAFLDLVKKVNKGFQPKLLQEKDYDQALNTVYKNLLVKLGKKNVNVDISQVQSDDVRDDQRLWLKYRDATSILFEHIAPSASGTEWQRYLTKVRIGELKSILRSDQNQL